MTALYIEGGNSLVGDVKIAGSKNSAMKVIVAALFTNEDVILENVPHTTSILALIDCIKAIGGVCEWQGKNTLIINGSTISIFEIPIEVGNSFRFVPLLAAPLLFRFGKAIIPKPPVSEKKPLLLNRWFDTWEALGFEVLEDPHFIIVRSGGLKSSVIDFKINTHTGTDNAILSSLFIPGETTIVNAAEEPEVDDLIAFCKLMGSEIKRIEPRVIKVVGRNIFKGCSFSVQSDRDEVITFATAAVVTSGNITIKNVNRENILSFVNFMAKSGCKFEFSGSEMRVWGTGQLLSPVDLMTLPAPGFMTNWQPFATLLLTKANGDSKIYETVSINRFEYIKDLNRMGSKIQLFQPSDLGYKVVISDDSYNLAELGEPYTVAFIHGPTKLKGVTTESVETNSAAMLVLASLSADGKSTVHTGDTIALSYYDYIDKLVNLGAVIEED